MRWPNVGLLACFSGPSYRRVSGRAREMSFREHQGCAVKGLSF